jgi:chaperonin GroES
MQTSLKPTGRNVVVRRTNPQDKSPGGIILPDTAKEKPSRGTVLAVGPGEYQNGTFVKTTTTVGQDVYFMPYSFSEFKHEGEDLLIIGEANILAAITH